VNLLRKLKIRYKGEDNHAQVVSPL
jgi:hypothetical protein